MSLGFKRTAAAVALTLAAATLTACVLEPAPYYGGAYYAEPAPVYVGPSYYYGPRYYGGPRWYPWRGGGWHGGGWHGGGWHGRPH